MNLKNRSASLTLWANRLLMAVIAALAPAMPTLLRWFNKLRHLSPASTEAQAAVADIQNFITDNFYTCTKQILAGLGQMYVADERFKANIDAAGGEGTADFVSRAIEIYCK